MRSQINVVVDVLRDSLNSIVEGIYLCGSAVQGGLKANSDLDFLVIVSQSLNDKQRTQLINCIAPYSRKIGEFTDLRYVEIVIVTTESLKQWNHPIEMDLIYGEWLRDEYTLGYVPQREYSSDLTIQLYQSKHHNKQLWGDQSLSHWLPDIPFEDVENAIMDSLNELTENADGDEVNCILTLCRMIDTLENKVINSKSISGRKVSEKFDGHKNVILAAVDMYELGIEPQFTKQVYDEVIGDLHQYISIKK